VEALAILPGRLVCKAGCARQERAG